MDDADRRATERREDAALVERARAEDPDAFGQLYDRWFGRVHDLAFRVTGDAAAAGDVAQEAFLAAWQKLETLRDPEAFGGWLLRITRNASLDRRRREERARPYDAEGMAMIDAAGPSAADAPTGFAVEDRTATIEDPARAAEDGELVALVWDSASALGERDAEVLDLMLRHGLEPAEIGEVVGLNRNAANQAVHRARSRLKTAVEARVLWRSGEPVCAALATELESAGISRFGADAVRAVTKHAEGCAECAERRQTRLEPSRLFAAAPIVAGSVLLRQKVAHALSDAGVPMDGSGVAGTGADPTDPSTGWSTHRGLRRSATALAITVVVLVLVGLFAEGLEEATDTRAADRSAATTRSTVPATTLPPEVTTQPTTVPTVPNRVVAPPPLPPPPPPASASISVSPSSEPFGYTVGRVVLSWSTANGESVLVSGPGFSNGAPSGSAAICPGPIRGSTCVAGRGTYTYTVTATGAGGDVVTRTATLTII